MITEDQYVSISEVRDQTTRVIKSLGQVGKKIILSQNKPVGIFLSIQEYNTLKKLSFLQENATWEDIQAYQKSSHGRDGVEAFSFLESLK